MASVTIRGLDETTKSRLRIRAAQHGRSMEEEVRQILKLTLANPEPPRNLVQSIRARFAPLGGVELPDAPRDPMRRPRKLGK
ncbi:MAG: FitA-like ribbon-helix-helix domain-containing protein [Terriglobia bacterium]